MDYAEIESASFGLAADRAGLVDPSRPVDLSRRPPAPTITIAINVILVYWSSRCSAAIWMGKERQSG